MRVAIASDHAGYRLKAAVASHLAAAGHQVTDLGTHSEEPVDYPGPCAAAGREVVARRADRAVIMGGTGQGEALSANKVHGVRAGLCWDEFSARLARQHNDVNVLSLGARMVAEPLALAILDVFLSTDFEGGRHARRLAQVSAIEQTECEGRDGE